MAKEWKRMTAARHEELELHRQKLRSEVYKIAQKREPFAFGHGYVWASVEYMGKRFRLLIGSLDGRADWQGITDEVNQLEGVSGAYINPD